MGPRLLDVDPAFWSPRPISPFCAFWADTHDSFGGRDMKQLLLRLWKEEEAQDLTEYALLLVLLTLAAVGSVSGLATAINGVFSSVATNLSAT